MPFPTIFLHAGQSQCLLLVCQWVIPTWTFKDDDDEPMNSMDSFLGIPFSIKPIIYIYIIYIYPSYVCIYILYIIYISHSINIVGVRSPIFSHGGFLKWGLLLCYMRYTAGGCPVAQEPKRKPTGNLFKRRSHGETVGSNLPSGKLTVCYGKSPFTIVNQRTQWSFSIANRNKLPEGLVFLLPPWKPQTPQWLWPWFPDIRDNVFGCRICRMM